MARPIRRDDRPLLLLGLFVAVCTALAPPAPPASAGTIYVNNLQGRDQCDGRLAVASDRLIGPVRTLARGVALAGYSDTIQIANTGKPYREDLRLFGRRHSGTAGRPFRVVGNGAVISGARPVPTVAWRREGRLWRLAPRRKGHYLLLRDGKPLPEHSLAGPAAVLDSIPDGQWASRRGRIYYRTKALIDSGEQNLEFATGDCGVSLYAVRHVVIENLVVQHWRLDGVNAPGLCSNVTLINVVCRENGRAGLTVSGSTQLRGERIELTGNRKYSLLIEDLAAADLVEAQLSQPPTFGR